MKKPYLILLSFFILCGCARIQEAAKVVWGSSTKALEDNRASATVKTYECFPGACFDTMMGIAQEKKYEVFISERKNNRIVLVGIPGSVDTTEVGIFITALKMKETKIEIVSLSSIAQQTVSIALFGQLDKTYPEIKEIPL
jgi:signal recognition particle GTPase